MKASSILGLNARTKLYSYHYNKNRGRVIAGSKIRTKRVLRRAGILVPDIYKVITKPENILRFDWQTLPDAFALKPSRGLGGEGIIVIKKRSKDGRAWITTSRKRVIEEYVGRHPSFRKYAFRGTPDIRVIVFNHVPVMAMLRLPTRDSGGRANLHQGAIGVGVDIATGITTHAIWYCNFITNKP